MTASHARSQLRHSPTRRFSSVADPRASSVINQLAPSRPQVQLYYITLASRRQVRTHLERDLTPDCFGFRGVIDGHAGSQIPDR
jgi:hypothetical protein